MSIAAGETLPSVKLKTITADGISEVDTAEMFAGKRGVLFAVPGAFTPTCSAKHLPSFIDHASQLKDKGFEVVACVSVNDAFVMDAWGKDAGAGETVMMLADGNAEFTKAIGLELDASGFGMGERSQRYAMVVNDGTVEHLFVEEGGGYEVCSAEHVLANA